MDAVARLRSRARTGILGNGLSFIVLGIAHRICASNCNCHEFAHNLSSYQLLDAMALQQTFQSRARYFEEKICRKQQEDERLPRNGALLASTAPSDKNNGHGGDFWNSLLPRTSRIFKSEPERSQFFLAAYAVLLVDILVGEVLIFIWRRRLGIGIRQAAPKG